MNILICENDYVQRKNLESTIKEEMLKISKDFRIVLSTDSPKEVIQFAETHSNENNIYFLDVDMAGSMDGFRLGKKIRELDLDGYIVYVSAYIQKALELFEYHIQVLDFIWKSNSGAKEKIRIDLEAFHDHVRKKPKEGSEKISINTGDRIYILEDKEILFFETISKVHKIRVHTLTKQMEFYGSLKDIEALVPKNYCKIHRSYLVNIKNIKELDKKNLIVKMINDEICYVSRNYMKDLINKCTTV